MYLNKRNFSNIDKSLYLFVPCSLSRGHSQNSNVKTSSAMMLMEPFSCMLREFFFFCLHILSLFSVCWRNHFCYQQTHRSPTCFIINLGFDLNVLSMPMSNSYLHVSHPFTYVYIYMITIFVNVFHFSTKHFAQKLITHSHIIQVRMAANRNPECGKRNMYKPLEITVIINGFNLTFTNDISSI